ncbi:Vacuolar protein sorting-associated protein ist1 [Chytridiales sp. JEL 0842]|nr:Vacuolar protein sorting-associated protein ist1 [Chytridiales sp. JEL 0842]
MRGSSSTMVEIVVNLKLALNRLRLLQQKKLASNQSSRREIAHLLEQGKDDSARVRVEHIIREDFAMEAMEILELYVEMLLARFGLLESMRHCDPAIAEAVNTIIYAAPRCDVKELSFVRDQLINKFGKDFAASAMENENDVVNPRIVYKLRIQSPDPILVDQYLTAIAKSFRVDWEGAILPADVAELNDPAPAPPSLIDAPLPAPSQPNSYETPQPTTTVGQPGYIMVPANNPPPAGYVMVPAPPAGVGVGQAYYIAQPQNSVQYMPPPFPPPPSAGSGGGFTDTTPSAPPVVGGATADFDELTRRFEALTRRK